MHSLSDTLGPQVPDALADIPVETVERAVRWMRAQPDLRSPPIVVEGDSKGAELALVAASHNRDLCAVVAFAPSSQVLEGFSTSKGARRASWTIDGTPLPYADNPMPSPVKMQIRAARLAHAPVSFRGQYLALATPPKENSTIPVWEIAGPLLLIAGRDDQLWPSDIFARRILDERAAHQSSFRDSALIFNHAGHQIDVPYMPTVGLSTLVAPGFSVALGGSPPAYARADADMWPKAISFMQRACR
jgi:dienelactone hydrolase